MDRHDVDDFRGIVQEATVVSIDDSGQFQTVTARTADDFVYADIEVLQVAGLASVPVGNGAKVLLLAVGGDPGNFRALPAANATKRFGNLKGGEAALYGPDGARVHARQGGIVEIKGGARVFLAGGNASILVDGTVTIIAPSGVTVTGNVTVDGKVTVNGELDVIGGPLKVNGVTVTVP